MTGVGRELLPALYMQRWGLFFFFLFFSYHEKQEPTSAPLAPPHTFSFSFSFSFFFPAFTGGYVLLFVSLFRVSLPQHTTSSSSSSSFSWTRHLTSFPLFIFREFYNIKATRQFIPPGPASHDGMPKR
jgi:hypothetical protein